MMNSPLIVCRSCRARIFFALTEKGRRMPIDAKPTKDGNVQVIERSGQTPVARVLGKHPLELMREMHPNRPLYTSHFATCTSAAAHRKRKQLDKERREHNANQA
jgi:hypothetical protein